MDEPTLIDFVKAMADADRLRIIGLLSQKPAGASEVATELGVPFRETLTHLDFLAYVGVVRKQDELYHLDTARLEDLARQQLSKPAQNYTPAPDMNTAARKVLTHYLNPDGSIKQIPSQAAKLRVILDYLVQAFTPGVEYKEQEVNQILRRFHVDTSGLRRDLVDSGLLARQRDGSRYWRPS